MKEHHLHHKHHETDNSLAGLLDHCGHFLTHHAGGRKRGQEGLLSVIAQNPGITQKELAEILNIQPASVSELLMKLEKKGLVLREKDEQDRRSIKVQLTDGGQKLLAKPEEEIPDLFQALSAEEQAHLRSLLEKLLTDWTRRYPGERRHNHHKHNKENHYGKHE